MLSVKTKMEFFFPLLGGTLYDLINTFLCWHKKRGKLRVTCSILDAALPMMEILQTEKINIVL